MSEEDMQTREQFARWRVGRKVGRTIYRQTGEEPSDHDELIGTMDTPEWAALVVRLVNTEIIRATTWEAVAKVVEVTE